MRETLFSAIHVCVALCVWERGSCVLRCKEKHVFFTVGRNQTSLEATDRERTNGAKQRVIANGIPRRERFNPRVAVRDGFPENFGSGKWALKEDSVWMGEKWEKHPCQGEGGNLAGFLLSLSLS